MLYYAIVFLLVAIAAGTFTFYNLERTAGLIAKVLCVLFLLLFLVSLLSGRTVRV
jgi:uncharacterized membrane protein YtjA (UPF0391 family)